MKVKNIMFFGFAAAILSGTANADPLQVASTAYVTSQLSTKADASTTYNKTEVNGLLNDKQDVIDDLSDIRSGAALGATALQQADLADYATTAAMNTALADKADANIIGEGFTTTNTVAAALNGKQGTISDLSDIRSGAALGATAVQPAALTTTLGDYATTSAMNSALETKVNVSDIATSVRTTGAADNKVASEKAVADAIDSAIANVTGGGATIGVLDRPGGGTYNSVSDALDGKQFVSDSTVDELPNNGQYNHITAGYAVGNNLEALDSAVGALETLVGNTSVQSQIATKADAATTLSGYGITDAYTKTQVDNALAAILPAANTCTSSNGHCVLSIDTSTGALTWVDVTTPWVTVE